MWAVKRFTLSVTAVSTPQTPSIPGPWRINTQTSPWVAASLRRSPGSSRMAARHRLRALPYRDGPACPELRPLPARRPARRGAAQPAWPSGWHLTAVPGHAHGRFDDVPLGGPDCDSLRGERASRVGSAEQMVRHLLLVQACPDEDVIEDLRMALDAPEGSPRTSHAVTASS